MADDQVHTPADFSSAFLQFLKAMNAAAANETTPLLDRLHQHPGADPTRTPIVAEEFESYEHPNVQVALDKVLFSNGRTAELVGISAQGKRGSEPRLHQGAASQGRAAGRHRGIDDRRAGAPRRRDGGARGGR